MDTHALFWKKFAVMLSSGVPLLVTLEALAGDDLGELNDAVRRLIAALQAGASFSEALASAPAFGRDVVEMVRSAEERGRLDEVAATIGEQIAAGVLTPTPAPTPDDAQEPDAERPEPPRLMALLAQAARERASDLHLEPTPEGGVARFRIDGLLQPRRTLTSADLRGLIAQLKQLCHLDVAERRIPQDGRALMELEGEGRLDLRVAIGPSVLGEAGMVRFLRKGNVLETLARREAIFPTADVRERVFGAARRGHGMLMVTGPTGSGKTTSLYALLTHHDAARHKLISVEEPVEVQLPGVHQIQTQPSLGLSFPAALRHVMRMDPDIVYCSEIRDADTAALLLRLAITGHLVYSQLHSPTAIDALMRFVNIGLEPHLIADATLGVLAQRLVRKLCPDCAAPSAEERDRLEDLLGAPLPDGALALRPVGCARCADTGYRGRRPIQQFVAIDPRVRQALCRRPTAEALWGAAREGGTRSLLERGLEVVYAGQTSLSEVLRVCPPEEIDRLGR